MPGLCRITLPVALLGFVLARPVFSQPTPLFQFAFGGEGTEDGQLDRPKGIDIQGDEVFVVENANYRVSVFDLAGNFLRNFGSSGMGPGQFVFPLHVVVATDGTSYVTDYLRHYVLKFDPAGDFVLEWGGQGSADEELNNPQGIEIDEDGDIWVVDRTNNAVKEFDSDGVFKSKIEGGQPMVGITDVKLNSDGSFFGTIWAGSYTGMRLFDAAGAALDSSASQFSAPQGLAQAPDGVLYVVSIGPTNRGYALDPATLDLIISWGGFGPEDENLNRPSDIDVTENGKIYVVAEESDLIKVFEVPVFADGFESGDTSGWSASVP